MALAFTKVKVGKAVRGVRESVVDITLDALYVNGTGWSVTPALIKMKTGIANVIYALIPNPCVDGYVFGWDQVNGKLKCYYADYDAVADGALVEIPTNHATVANKKVRCIVIGN